MEFKKLIAVLLIPLLMLHLNACYTTRNVRADKLQLGKKDKIVSYEEKGEDGKEYRFITGDSKFLGAYLYGDTLFVKIRTSRGEQPEILEYSIPVSDIRSLELKKYDARKTRILVGTSVGILGAAILAFALFLIIGFLQLLAES